MARRKYLEECSAKSSESKIPRSSLKRKREERRDYGRRERWV